ncbi:MAG: type II secretion system F family protein [Bacilli bacterium]|nr:type II secretion system F family protein [Bacilli bacterium]
MVETAHVHKQDNFFIFFFVYFCLGVYYTLRILATPFTFIWNLFSNGLYNTVNAKVTDKELYGAYMGKTEAQEVAEQVKEKSLAAKTVTKEIRVNKSLINARQNLINTIDANDEVRHERPVTYKYVALDPTGKQVSNIFVAYSRVEVYTFLENEGYKVFKIETSPWIEKFYGESAFANHKISNKNIVFWLDQLSTYIRAGIPLTDAMRILAKQMGKNMNINRVFNSIVYNLTLGESFSNALEKQGEAFPALLVNMVKSAEATGDLEGTLEDMAKYYREVETTRKDMIQALSYPALVFVFAIGVVIFMLVYLIPQFVTIYNTANVTLNPITAAIINASGFMKANLFYIFLTVAIIIGVFLILYKNLKAFRYTAQTIAMKIPVLGKVIIYKEMTIFTKTFSSLLKNNVYITESMDILGKVTTNEIYREIMINTINCIGRGEKISVAFKDNWAIPEVAYYMMVTGESTGQLSEMMGKVSDYYSEQHKLIVNTLKTLIEPILIVFLAVAVGFILIAIVVPIFSLYGQIQQ